MPFSRSKADSEQHTTQYPDPACLDNDPNCDLTRYLVVLVVVLIVIALIMCICRQFMRLVIGKRNRQPPQPDTDVIYPREDHRSSRAHQNFGFMDPPPRYEQIFKRNGGTPSVITTRHAPSVTNSSGDTGLLPPSYEQAAIVSRAHALSQNTIRELPLGAVDMEHPTMPSPASTVLDIESEITNIQNHARACVHRYDSTHADEVARTAASITVQQSVPTSSAPALPELEAPEDGPPGYDAISLHNETPTVSTR